MTNTTIRSIAISQPQSINHNRSTTIDQPQLINYNRSIRLEISLLSLITNHRLRGYHYSSADAQGIRPAFVSTTEAVCTWSPVADCSHYYWLDSSIVDYSLVNEDHVSFEHAEWSASGVAVAMPHCLAALTVDLDVRSHDVDWSDVRLPYLVRCSLDHSPSYYDSRSHYRLSNDSNCVHCDWCRCDWRLDCH